jgi:RNA polymerase sigma factor (sigma-70 family)
VLFERHARPIYSYCFRRVGNWTEAEDLLSVVFLEAWRRRDVHLADGMVLRWLYGVATNVRRNASRSHRRYQRALRRMPPPKPTPDFSSDVGSRLDDEMQMQVALALVGRLREEEQDVFRLCGWSELSYEEAAAALRVPVGTVRSRLSRARAHLRELGVELGQKKVEHPNRSRTRDLTHTTSLPRSPRRPAGADEAPSPRRSKPLEIVPELTARTITIDHGLLTGTTAYVSNSPTVPGYLSAYYQGLVIEINAPSADDALAAAESLDRRPS